MSEVLKAGIYLAIFLISFVIIIMVLLESNIHTLFKQGKIVHIRLAYLLIAFISSYLLASGFLKLIEVLLLIGQN